MNEYEELEKILETKNFYDIPIMDLAIRLNRKHEFLEAHKGIYARNSLVPLNFIQDEENNNLEYDKVINGEYKGNVRIHRSLSCSFEEALEQGHLTTNPGRMVTVFYAIMHTLHHELIAAKPRQDIVYMGTPGKYPRDNTEILGMVQYAGLKERDEHSMLCDTVLSSCDDSFIDLLYKIEEAHRNDVICLSFANNDSIRISIGPDYRILEWSENKIRIAENAT